MFGGGVKWTVMGNMQKNVKCLLVVFNNTIKIAGEKYV